MTRDSKTTQNPEVSQKLDDTILEVVSGGAALAGGFPAQQSADMHNDGDELQKAAKSPIQVSGRDICLPYPFR